MMRSDGIEGVRLMRRWIAGLALASLLASPLVWPAGSELSRLRSENMRLKAQLSALRQSCPAAASSAASPLAATPVPPAAASATPPTAPAVAVPADAGLADPSAAAVTPSPPLPAPAAAGPSAALPDAQLMPPAAAAAVAPAPASSAAVANYTVPSGYQLVPVKPTSSDQDRYKTTGCDQGFLKGPPPGKWRNDDAWKPIHVGMTMSEVEAALGAEHYDVTRDGVLEWHYGQCGPTAEAVVRFNAGQVDAWRAPD